VTPRDDARITAFGLVAEVFLGLSERLEAQLSGFDLRPLEFEVILRLGRSPGSRLRMSDLATQAHITTSGVTRVVDRLEQDGLVKRVACATDRRGYFAELTEAGEERLDQILPGHVEIIETWFTGRLPGGRLTDLLNSLRTVRDAVRPGATAGA
jgi:MarR family 2-MHQ and catechol resistance regulon transcriptional repressor